MPCAIQKHLLQISVPGKIITKEWQKKTVIKQLLKYAPIKSDFQKAITLDETVKTQLSVDMSEVHNEEFMEGDNSTTV